METTPVAVSQTVTPYFSATGPETSRPSGMAADMAIAHREKARPIFSRGMFSQAVGLLLASQAKAERYRAENEKLRQKLEELRVVSRAKCLLVEYLHLDEESAHKYMERQAMEERKTRRAVAEEILREYG